MVQEVVGSVGGSRETVLLGPVYSGPRAAAAAVDAHPSMRESLDTLMVRSILRFS